jgi:hypothetical protein
MYKNMKKLLSILALSLLLSGCALGHAQQLSNKQSVVSNHIAPDALYPNPKLTQGKADTLNIQDLLKSYNGQTYSQFHRSVNTAEHKQVYDEYQVNPQARNIQFGEVDHFYPLCAGGSNDISNLWYQPLTLNWNGQNFGFKTKDKLETYICQQIKAQKITPQDAYNCIVSDWISCFLKYKNQLTNNTSYNFGGAVE